MVPYMFITDIDIQVCWYTSHVRITCSPYRLGQPEDCGGTVSFLCSDDASYITGEIILVTGGMQARL